MIEWMFLLRIFGVLLVSISVFVLGFFLLNPKNKSKIESYKYIPLESRNKERKVGNHSNQNDDGGV